MIVVEEVAVQALDELAQCRGQCALFGRALAVGEAHRRVRVTDVQRPDVGHDIAPRGDLDLHPQIREDSRHIGDGLLKRQVFTNDVSARLRRRMRHQQRLRVGVEVFNFLDHKLGTGLHDLLHRAAINRTQNAQAILFRDVRRQFDLNLEDLVVAVFRVDNVVLRQANIVGRDIARFAIQLHKVSRAQGRRRQEVVERPRCRAIALIADGLIGDHREVVELGFKSKVVEKVDLDFHAGLPESKNELAAIIRVFSLTSCAFA